MCFKFWKREILILITTKSSIWASERTYPLIFLLVTKWFPKSNVTNFSSLQRHVLLVNSLYWKWNKIKTPNKKLSQGIVSVQRTRSQSFLSALPSWGSTGNQRILLNGHFWWCPRIWFLEKEFGKKLLTNPFSVSKDHVNGWLRTDTNNRNNQ